MRKLTAIAFRFNAMAGGSFLSYVLASLALEASLAFLEDFPASTEWLSLISACFLILTTAIWMRTPTIQKSRRLYRNAGVNIK